MIIWLVKAGEPTPLDSGTPRVMRTGHLARFLADRGHTVVWWTAAFDHQRKVVRTLDSQSASVSPGFEIQFVESLGYTGNVSFRRWIDDMTLAVATYRRMAKADSRPDVIVCAYPLIFTSMAVTLFARRRGLRLLVDVRDMWPDIFCALSGGLRGRLYRLFARINRPLGRYVLGHADSLTGITDPFLDWGLNLAGRSRSDADAVFPLTTFPSALSAEDRSRAIEEWRALGVTGQTLNFCYFGSFTSMVDMTTVLSAARMLASRQDIRLILCGLGDDFERLKSEATGLSTLMLPGWVDAARMTVLMEMSLAGLAPYRNRRDALSALSNKVIEYLSFGLPVIAGLEGLLGELVDNHACGLKYAEGDARGLARAMTELADHPDTTARLSRNAKTLYERRFDPSLVYKQFAEHVERAATLKTQPNTAQQFA
jgi:glycosyltransferase involved in cell wall biosynthesis